MPKIIENLPQRLLEEARRQISQEGYSAMTIRSVASGCGVGVGTVYNYYASKDELVAAFMLEDWQKCICHIRTVSDSSEEALPVLASIHTGLTRFIQAHEAVFRDSSAAAGFAGSFSRYHGLLRSQIALPLKKFCPDSFTADFIAEAMLTWTVAGKSIDEISSLVIKLL